jgi:hypothetical protein
MDKAAIKLVEIVGLNPAMVRDDPPMTLQPDGFGKWNLTVTILLDNDTVRSAFE